MTEAPPPINDLELLDLLLGQEAAERPERRGGTAVPPMLSRAQRRIWFLCQAAPDSPAYTMLCPVRLSGRLDLEVLRRSLGEVVRRHDALRTCFPAVDGRPATAPVSNPEPEIAVEDLSTLPEAERSAALAERCSAEARRPFDLSTGPLLRLRLLRLAPREHVALLGLHHIVADGWSMGVLVSELGQIYAAYAAGRPSPLAEPDLRYADFTAMQEEWLGQEPAREQRRWWTEQLAGLAPLELPTDRPRPALPSQRGAVHAFALPEEVAVALREVGRRAAATPFMTLLAGFAVLLHRYTGQEDIAIGFPAANRTRREWEPLIGLFVNSLVLRCDLSGRPGFLEFLRRVREFATEALARQELPFEEMVKALAPDRDGSANPLFQVMFSYDTAPPGPIELPDVTVAPVEVPTGVAKFDLLLNVSEQPGGRLTAALEYATDLFDAETVERMAGHLSVLLAAIASDPEVPVGRLPLMAAAERRQLATWNDTATPYPREAGLATLFERQAGRSPGAIAAEFGAERLSYAALNARANRLARRLRGCGVGLGTPVALHAQRSAAMVVGMLAIIKAGGAYVPLDPSHPAQRLERMLADCRAPVLLAGRDLLGRLSGEGHLPLCLDEEAAGGEELDPDWPAARGGDLAYIIYTSGSTGEPKGVAVSHRAVARLVLDTNYVALGPGDVVAQASNASFDAATFEVWGALLNGARLVGIEREVVLSPPQLTAGLSAHRVTTLFLTTALFNQIARDAPAAFRGLRTVMFGGEQVDPHWVRQILRHGPPERLLHVYGPSENTTFSTWKQVRDLPEGAATVPIGAAVSNTRLHVLDGEGQELPVGIPGELHLAGDGLALGYHGRPEATAAAFVQGDAGTRLYRTGDIVRRLPDGDLVFLGRRDGQVKIRGHRIELGEVEAALCRLPGVREAAVLAREDQPGWRMLVAYVVGAPDPAALRQGLAERLPGYMVPSRFVPLSALPLNENGKLDRRALPPPGEDGAGTAARPPADRREESLVAVWQDVLGRATVGVYDHYFELGGDSITAIQVVSRLRRLGWQLRVADLFRHPRIAELAPHLRPASEAAEAAAADQGEAPLTAVQRWFLTHHGEDAHQFNQSVLLRAAEPLEEAALRRALAALLDRHDALRLRLVGMGAALRQAMPAAGEAPALSVLDLRDAADPGAAMDTAAEAIQRGLHLRHGPVLRAGLFRRADGDRLLVAVHHMAVDAVSWRILLEELEFAYAQAAAGQEVALGPPGCSFHRWATTIAGFADNAELAGEADYWAGIEAAEVGRLPTARTGARCRHGDAETLSASLPAEATAEFLTRAPRAYGTEIMDLLLTALGRTLRLRSGGAAARIMLEGHGREPPDDSLDLSRTVGWFTSLYPCLLALPDAEVGAQISWVKAMLRQVPRKGLGYGVLRYLAGRGAPPGPDAAPQLAFNYLGQFEPGGEGVFAVSEESSGRAIAPHLPRLHEIDLTGLVTGGRLLLSLTFEPASLAGEEAASLLREVLEQIGEVVRHCRDRLAAQPAAAPAPAALPAGEVEDEYQLSPLQEGMLFESLLDPGSDSYFVQVRFRASGALDPEAFHQAWIALCRRHAVLRSAILHEDRPRPMQAVLRDRPPEFSFADVHGLPEAERAAWMDAYCLEQRSRGFDLQRAPLLRVALFREAEDVHHIVWSYHHILIDGWCLAILQRDFLEIYAALVARRLPRLPPAVPYRRYIEWLERQDREAARRFWRDALAGYDTPATLPRSAAAAPGQPRVLAEETLILDAAESAGLVRLAAATGVTLSSVLQALWGLLLSRYNDRDEVVFGTIVSGRPAELPGVEEMVGLFIGAVPVRVVARPEMGFTDLLRAVQAATLASEPHQHLPLAEIQAESAPGRALFDHMLIFENYPRRASGGPAEGGAEPEFTPVGAYDPTHYDLDVTVAPGERISVRFTFDTRVHHPDQLRRTAGHLRTAIVAILRDPRRPLHEIDVLPWAEADLVLRAFNATEAPYRRELSFADRFEAQARRRPEAVALRCGDAAMTYGALNRAANRLAHHLRAMGVGPEVPVGLCVERTPEMVVGPLAILKAGGAFVPLAPDYPPERLGFMLEDAGAAVTLTTRRLAGRLPPTATRLVLLDEEAAAIAARPDGDPPRPGMAERPAYVIYTSGSTGRPKGVAVTHGSLANMAEAWGEAYGLDEAPPCLLQMASMSFDVFVGDLVRALAHGGTLVVCPTEALADPAGLHRLLLAHRVTILEGTPGLLLPLMEHIHRDALPLGDLRILVIGSDMLSARQFRTLLERFGSRLRLFNSYGVTEATIDSSLFEAGDPAALDLGGNTPIGRPMRNTRFYVLDRHGNPQPIGVPGELHIGGAGVARGYVNRPELTAARFVAACPGREERLYRTGDLARWRPDGIMEFLGRIDDQLKIRGHRIEPGEIEHYLLRCDGVRQAIVLARELDGGLDLAAYVVADAGFDVARVRAELRRALPDHLVPGAILRIDRLPLTPNGKLDRRALPHPRLAAGRDAGAVPPRTGTEAALAALWREVLQLPEIGMLDDFFALGGHSLKAMQITARIHRAFGVQVPLRDFFGTPTIAALADLVEAGAGSAAWSAIPPAPPQEHYALSHAQRRLWMLHHMEGAAAYNMPEAHLVGTEVNHAALERALRRLFRRHEALRTAFVVVEGEPRQRILEAVPFAVAEFDLRGSPAPEPQAREIAERDAVRPFDLAVPPLLRASLVHLPGRRSLFVLVMHHIIGDGWSGNIVFRELLALYDAERQGHPDPLKPLRIQYKDFAAWHAARGFDRQEAYWLDRLSGMPDGMALPYDKRPEALRDFSGGNLSIELDGTVTAGLRRLALRRGITLSALLLAVFELFLFHWTREEDVCVGMSMANRSHPDAENLIGFFVNILPIRCRLSAEMEFDELLAMVTERTREALDHQDYPFDLLVQRLNPARQANRQPLVNVVYAFQNFADVHVEVGGVAPAAVPGAEVVGWTPFDLSFATSKFDLTLFVQEDPERIRLTLEYDSALFLAATIREQLRTIAGYAGMIAGVAEP